MATSQPSNGAAAAIGEQELAEIYAFAVQVAKDAGALLMKAQKESSVDIVTETDMNIEAFIHQSITARYPTHKFIGEESYSQGSDKRYLVDDAPTWIVDPLDGTVNFAHLFPMVCISIGFTINGHPVVGVINAPILNQMVSACRGRGAWLNETQRLPLVHDPIPRSPKTRPGAASSQLGGRGGKGGMAHGVRSLGSAAMGLAYAAMGSVDIWMEGGCWEWDVAGGIAILEEAGGFVTTANPPGDPETCEIPKVRLGGRLPAGASEKETALEAQQRVVREAFSEVPQSYMALST
ncbi:unnamed protein product [Parascedosporium putredinis]|uniref:Inositol-1-monophosphatase n=1 Tax=Parascedosporium putredinis TaxID=1442378 RepID=A0A9P1GWK2_9PEZI|nr:unnamed protein product [Parascedosporium putredinis]CAI7989613.1 unnamed protein product [Parascedosporium putredinis]